MSGFGWKCSINLPGFVKHFHPNPSTRTLLGFQMPRFGWKCSINLLRFVKHFHPNPGTRTLASEPWHPNPARISDVKVRVEMIYKLAKVCKTCPSEPWHPNPARVSDATVRVEMLYKPPLIITSVLLAFQLPKRICNEGIPNRFRSLSPSFYEHSGSQRGSAVNESQIVSPHYHLCFISIPAPKEDLH